VPSPRRREKLNNLLREELSKVLDREFEFPKNTFVTITRAEISSDGHYGNIFVSLLGAEPENAFEILQKNIGTIQHFLNRRLRIRPVPKIRFVIDKDEFQRERIEKSLAELKKKGDI